jgi:RNA polymerase sigma-70 factor (ECF subfamily)
MLDRRRHPRPRQLTEAEAARVADVFQEHEPFIRSVARRHAVTPDAVPDIVQSVGLKVCLGLGGFRGESQLKTWLFRVTVNEARSHYADEHKASRVQDALATTPEPDRVLDPDDRVMVGQRLEALARAVDRLRPIYREAVLQDIGNKNGQPTIQTDQSVKESSLRTRRHRAQQQLRRIMDDGTA